MKDSFKYKFYGKVALEYRLSLENLCKLMKLEITEENKKMVYENILANTPLKNEFKYLFYYETLMEPEDISKDSYLKALKFLNSYAKAKKEKNKDEEFEILKQLADTDRDFDSLKGKTFENPFTEEEATKILKYRIKYRISRTSMAEAFGVGEKKLVVSEEKITDSILLRKLRILSDYFIDADNLKRRKSPSIR